MGCARCLEFKVLTGRDLMMLRRREKPMLTLVEFEPEHFRTLASWLRSERDLVQWGGPDLTYPLTDPQLEQMVEEGKMTPPARLCWMAVDVAQTVVGHVQLALDWKNGVARVARVIIAPEVRGRGHASALLEAVVKQAFSYGAIERTELNVYSWNTAAVRTYNKVGFSHKGLKRSSVRVGDERWDTAVMGILRPEWEARQL